MLNEIKRPSLDVTLEVDIPEIQPIKHDLAKVEVFVTKLDEFYKNAIDEAIANFSLDIKEVKAERTKVRKVLKTIEDNRKAMVNAFKEPIKDFEETSKRIEKVLKGTDEFMKELVKVSSSDDTTVKSEQLRAVAVHIVTALCTFLASRAAITGGLIPFGISVLKSESSSESEESIM